MSSDSPKQWKNSTVLAAGITALAAIIVAYWQFGKPVQKSVQLAVYVKERGTEKALPNVEVVLQRQAVRQPGTTDSVGQVHFEIPADAEGTLRVSAHIAGYITGSLELDVPRKDSNCTLFLEPEKQARRNYDDGNAPNPVQLTVHVKERGTEKALSNVQVILQHQAIKEGRNTDNLGTARFEISPDTVGPLRLRAYIAGYVDSGLELEVPRTNSNCTLFLELERHAKHQDHDLGKSQRDAKIVVIHEGRMEGFVGEEYLVAFKVKGGRPPYTLTEKDPIPGLTLNVDNRTLSGKPTAQGKFNFSLQVTDDAGVSATDNFDISIRPSPPRIHGNTVVDAKLGESVFLAMAVTGGTAPYVWSADGLPDGVTINPQSGVIAGTASESRSYFVIVHVFDAENLRTEHHLELRVSASLRVFVERIPVEANQQSRQLIEKVVDPCLRRFFAVQKTLSSADVILRCVECNTWNEIQLEMTAVRSGNSVWADSFQGENGSFDLEKANKELCYGSRGLKQQLGSISTKLNIK